MMAGCERESICAKAVEAVVTVPLDCEATLQRVLQQGRCSLRRLLRVADEVPHGCTGIL